jgi:hypothetical protein
MAIVSGLSNYRFIAGEKIGLTGGPTQPPLGASQWAPATVYPAGAKVVNSGFLYSTVAGGTSAAAVAGGPCPARLTDNTVTWVLQGAVGGPYLVTTAQVHELGLVMEMLDSGPNAFGVAEAMYVKFSGTTVPGDFVTVDRYNFTAAQTATTQRGIVAISLGVGASGSYGWVLIRGVHDYCNLGNGASTVGAITYESATAGRILTTVSGTNGVPGIVIKVTGDASNVGAADMYWPVAAGNP